MSRATPPSPPKPPPRPRHTSAAEYLHKTESAMQHLFDGMRRYSEVIARVRPPVFVHDSADGLTLDRAFNAWQTTNAKAINAALQAEREYIAETFALATLAGAVLQIAEKAFELYGKGTVVPTILAGAVGVHLAKYFSGKEVRGVPLGAAIYAGRNQHVHYEQSPHTATEAILNIMARHGHPEIVDPALDPHNHGLYSMANNIVYLVGWDDYSSYVRDMRQALAV